MALEGMNMTLASLGIQAHNSGASTGQSWWSEATRNAEFSAINPANEEAIAHVYSASSDDLEKVISSAHQGFLTWREVPAPKRGEVVRRIANRLREHKDALGTLVSLEAGKIKQEGDGEVQEMIDIADFAVGQSRMLYGLMLQSERPKHRMYEQWYPLGPIAVITAFNFPVAVWAWNAMIAAICGNTIIWKPSPKTPLTAIAVQHICNQVCAELGYESIFNLFISNDNQLVESLVDDTRIPLVSFTGSTVVGRHIATKVAARLGRSILELSGNNAVIVDESADMKKVVPSIVFGAVGTAGQRCTSTRRVIVHQSRSQALLDHLKHAYHQVKIGDPLQENILMGPLIDKEAVEKFSTRIEEINEHGGEIITGGHVLEKDGYFVEPTIVCAKADMPFVSEETFAPILYVMTYEDISDAIMIHNQVPQGLSSAMFTEKLQHAEQFLSVCGSDCGIANINIGTSGAEIGGAFGGEKETGGGREAGSDAWKAYMRRQTNTINWSNELPLAQGITFDIDIGSDS